MIERRERSVIGRYLLVQLPVIDFELGVLVAADRQAKCLLLELVSLALALDLSSSAALVFPVQFPTSLPLDIDRNTIYNIKLNSCYRDIR